MTQIKPSLVPGDVVCKKDRMKGEGPSERRRRQNEKIFPLI